MASMNTGSKKASTFASIVRIKFVTVLLVLCYLLVLSELCREKAPQLVRSCWFDP